MAGGQRALILLILTEEVLVQQYEVIAEIRTQTEQ